MKKLVYSIFAIGAMSLVSCGGAETPENTEKKEEVAAVSGVFNTAEGSSIVWKAKHYGDADFVHVGTVPTSGNVVVENNQVVGGEFSFDLVKLHEEGDNDYTKMLEGHLQDSTFFFTSMFPNATFTITSATATSVTGELSVIGASQTITIDGTLTVAEGEVALVGTTTVDMLGFNMPYLLESEQAPEDKKSQSPDPKIVIEIDLKLAKAAM